MAVAMSDFDPFLGSALGAALLASERRAVECQLPSLAGYSLLQLSVQRASPLAASARVGQYISMGFAPTLECEHSDNLWADYQAFPIASDCIDIVLLHHVLEFSMQPQQLLREADRTLTAGGHMLVVGFNPLSAWSLYRRMNSRKLRLAAQHRPMRMPRLCDWLSVLNYDVVHQRSYFHRLPVNSAGLLQKFEGAERLADQLHSPFGLFYLVVARKRTVPVNVIRNPWPRRLRRPSTARQVQARGELHRCA